ncbi:MAG TPA: hypothetical protein DHW64_07050 [Chitinophagaceae bacterium]|jgi:hypothetical protein|nr:hypothetical protein [Chitinophagaceae bacterium]
MIPAIFMRKKFFAMPNEQRKCLTCERIIHGRVDKKFCNDYCRSAFNNKKHLSDRGLIRRVNYLLLKNRYILEYFLKGSHPTATIMRKALSAKGFQFDFFTHTYHTADGKQYFCCYDHAYIELFNEELLITRIAARAESLFIPYNEFEQV